MNTQNNRESNNSSLSKPQIETNEVEKIDVEYKRKSNSVEKPESRNSLDNSQNLNNISLDARDHSNIDPAIDQTGLNKFYSLDRVLDLKHLIKNRLSNLTNDYIFSQNYSDNIICFYRKLNSIIIAKIEHCLDFNKKYISFFRHISSAYQRFSKDLEKANDFINHENNQGMILSSSVNSMMERAQAQITQNFSVFSAMLNNKVVSQGPVTKMKDLYLKLAQINKEVEACLNRVVKQKANIKKIFTMDNRIYEEFKKTYNDNEALSSRIFSKYEFYLMEYKLSVQFKQLNFLTKDFLLQYKEKLLDLCILLLDYVTLIKEHIDSYIEENRKIFSGNFNFEEMQKHYDSISKDTVEAIFSPQKMIQSEEIDVDREYLKVLDEILAEYQKNLLISNTRNIGNVEIKDFEKFKLESYKTFREFMEYMILVNPIFSIDLSEYITLSFNVLRDNGMIMQNWLGSRIVITKQDSVLIFDDFNGNIGNSVNTLQSEMKEDKLVDKLSLRSTRFSEKSSINKPFRFSLLDTRKGLIFTSKLNYEFDAVNKEQFHQLREVFEKAAVRLSQC